MNRSALLIAAALVAAVLVVPATAVGGGWATVGISSLPDDTRPGEAWVVDLTVLQHGRTPLEGVRPAVIVRPSGGGAGERFRAKPTGEPGIYRATVVFPSKGEWTYFVDDDFSAVHQVGSVRFDGSSARGVPTAKRAGSAPASAPADSGGVGLPGALGIALAGGLLAALAAMALQRHREPAAG